jgi:hypothetical protein
VSQLGHKIPCRFGGRKKIGGDIRVAAAVARRSNETREEKRAILKEPTTEPLITQMGLSFFVK